MDKGEHIVPADGVDYPLSPQAADMMMAEWKALRSEILLRVELQHRIIQASAVAVGGLAIAASTVIDRGWHPLFLVGAAFFFALGAQYVEQDRLIARAGMYINRTVKKEVKTRLAPWEPALGWEEFRGRSLTAPEKRMATLLSFIRYVPSIGAGIGSIVAFIATTGIPSSWWEYALAIPVLFLGILLCYSAWRTHGDYNLIWDDEGKHNERLQW